MTGQARRTRVAASHLVATLVYQIITLYPDTRKYMHAETLALLTKPLYFPNVKYLK
jgi:hypothetical protein